MDSPFPQQQASGRTAVHIFRTTVLVDAVEGNRKGEVDYSQATCFFHDYSIGGGYGGEKGGGEFGGGGGHALYVYSYQVCATKVENVCW